MEVHPPGHLREFLGHFHTVVVHLAGIGHTGGIRKGDLGDAGINISLRDALDIAQGDLFFPRRAEGHGDRAGNGDACILGGIHSGLKACHALLGGAVQVGQIVCAGSRNIQLHLFAAAGGSALYTAGIGDQGTVFHALLLHDALKHFVGVGHLGHFYGVHERAHFHHRHAGLYNGVDQLHLILGTDNGFFCLQAVAGTHFANDHFIYIFRHSVASS